MTIVIVVTTLITLAVIFLILSVVSYVSKENYKKLRNDYLTLVKDDMIKCRISKTNHKCKVLKRSRLGYQVESLTDSGVHFIGWDQFKKKL